MNASHVYPGACSRWSPNSTLAVQRIQSLAILAFFISAPRAFGQMANLPSTSPAVVNLEVQSDSKTPRPAQPSFDVASIHLNDLDRTGHSHIYFSLSDSHFRCINVTAIQLVQWAWELSDSRIIGAPAWATSAHYDIEAKSDPVADEHFHSLTPLEARREKDQMVQALLADRFHLAAHLEAREQPVYFMVLAKGGAKLMPGQDAPRHIDNTGRGSSVTVSITNSSRAAADLAEELYRYTGRVVIDKTGLTGNYTLALHFSADDARAPIPTSAESAGALDSGPSVFTALKDQLGLELKSGKTPVDVLVVDHMEPPSSN